MTTPVPANRLQRPIKTPRDRHLFGAGPKRILAIDGGGVRGVIALEFLAEIEKALKKRTGNSALVLSDYFDLIGGTSTGAIIAAGLALGLEVAHLLDVYSTLSKKGFQKNPWLVLGGIIAPKFKERPLAQAIEEHVGDETLGSEKLRTGHLETLETPALILQGTRDAFGTPEDVAGYRLSPAIRVVWLEDGDHSWKPRASSGRTEAQNMADALAVMREFLAAL